MITSFDRIGIKHAYITTGTGVITELARRGLPNYNPNTDQAFVELSWGSGADDEQFDCAINSTGISIDDAIRKCGDYLLYLHDYETEDYSSHGLNAVWDKYAVELNEWLSQIGVF